MVAGVVGTWCQGLKKCPQRNSETEMHRQMHRTDVVPELAGRRSISLVARSKKLNRLIDQSPGVQLHDDQFPSIERSVVGVIY